ncbi:MAG TPA: type II toxin-antitoxin system Phd/YefM family antitoxin [Vicinamibacterales bacterium]|jgi:prevent-host-death family protein
MPKKYSIAEARSQLPTIVDEAEAGIDVELTRHGRPVAVVVSHREFERLQGRRRHFGDAYRQFLRTHDLREIGTDHDFARKLRDRSSGRKVSL